MLEQKDFKLNGNRMVIQQLPSTKSLEVLLELANILQGAANGVGNIDGDISEANINPFKVVAGIIDSLDSDQTPEFIRQLVSDSLVKPEYSNDWFDTHFSGNLIELYDLLAEILKLNKYDELVKKRLMKATSLLFS